MTKFTDVLKNRNFLFLWLGQVISNFGDRLNQMALVALVYQRNPGSEIALAKLISFTILPVFVIGPIAGAWVDRLNRKNVMIISDIVRGALVILIPTLFFMKQIIPIYLIIFITFSISRFFIPSKMAIIPDLVSKDKLLIANTLQDTTHMIGNVVGLLVAGLIVNVACIGAVGGFYIDAATFFVSAGLIAMMAHSGSHRAVSEDIVESTKAIEHSLRRSIFSEIKEGMKYLKEYSEMHFILRVFFTLMAGLGAISCVIIVFIQEAFGTSTKHLGFLGTYLVVGLFAGTLLYGRLGQKLEKKRAISLSFILSGLSVILFTVVVYHHANIFLAGFLCTLIGIAVSPIMISSNTLTHETIPEEARGRIFSSLEAVIHLGFMAAMFLAAYAAKYVGRFWILIIVGLAFSVCGTVWMSQQKRVTS